MLFAFLYVIISTLIIYGIYLLVSKKWNKLTVKNPLILSVINLILTLSFLALFIAIPSSFDTDVSINNPLIFMLFLIFATYFYLLIIPISGLHILLAITNQIYDKNIKKYLLILFSVLSMGIVLFISISIF